MGRSNPEFQKGLHHEPQPEDSEWTPKYEGETLYHGSPHEITDNVIKPGKDSKAWATDHPKEATVYGKYNGGEKATHVYEIKPVDPNEITGIFGPRMYENGIVKHFHSNLGFHIIRKLD